MARLGLLANIAILAVCTQPIYLSFLSAVVIQGQTIPGGGWFEVVLENAGIASMHSAVTRFDTVILLDRTNIGESNISLPNGICRDNPVDKYLQHDCTAHSVLFNPADNTVRPLYIFTDSWCSLGQFSANGTMIQAGGEFEGTKKVRLFDPCPADMLCDWVEQENMTLADKRWYSSSLLLPDDRMFVIGGRKTFTYEFIPRRPDEKSYFMSFLNKTKNFEQDNLYPFVFMVPDGNLYIFANRDSILFDYNTNKVLKTYPTIPGEPRNYPSGGSSVLLAMDPRNNYTVAEILVCGGAQEGAFTNLNERLGASETCGRMEITSPTPSWSMETMPMRRNMGDMIILPTTDVLIINGGQNGSQGWRRGSNPALNPVLYRPYADPAERFLVYTETTIPRMYHSTAVLLADGRILLTGSNVRKLYTFNDTLLFPTELRVEAFYPPYLQNSFDYYRPRFTCNPTYVVYGQTFGVTISLRKPPLSEIQLNMYHPPFATHSFSQGQVFVKLQVISQVLSGKQRWTITAIAPPSSIIAPRGYYMLWANNHGIPSKKAAWIHIS